MTADRTKRLRHKIADELEAGLEAGLGKPDADRIAWLERKIAALTEEMDDQDNLTGQWEQLCAQRNQLRAELSRLRNDQPKGTVVCLNCHGAGHDSDTLYYCKSCNGSGLISLRNEQPELNSRGEPMDHATIARGRKPTDAGNAPLSNEQPKEGGPYKAQQCDDGTWMVCTDGDVVGTFDSNGTDQQQRAEHTAELLNRAEAAPSPATSPGPQDVRVTAGMIEAAGAAARDLRSALAQSDARPVAWQADLKDAIDFIEDEYRDASYEPEGEWLPPEARRIHAKLVALFTTPPSLPEGAREVLEPTDEMAKTFYSAFDKAGLSDQYQAAKAGLKAVFENLATPTTEAENE